jgi:hypothetical protein
LRRNQLCAGSASSPEILIDRAECQAEFKYQVEFKGKRKAARSSDCLQKKVPGIAKIRIRDPHTTDTNLNAGPELKFTLSPAW